MGPRTSSGTECMALKACLDTVCMPLFHFRHGTGHMLRFLKSVVPAPRRSLFRGDAINTPDGFHEMDDPLFNYTFQTDVVDNRFPSGDTISLHPAMKTENFARPRRLDLQALDGKFSVDRSALEC